MREIRRMAIEDFGHDHWSAFAYLETRCVNHRGRPDTRHMRVDLKRHPGKGHSRVLIWGLGRCDYFVVFPPVAMVGFRGSGIGLGER